MDPQNTPNPNPTFTPPTPPPAGQSSNTGMAILAYLGILVVIPFLTDAKNDQFVKFHIKQGLVLLIIEFVGMFVYWVPIFGWALWVVTIVFVVIGIMNASAGKQKELPLIGKFAHMFNF
jgi:uncharacterized membrane protein